MGGQNARQGWKIKETTVCFLRTGASIASNVLGILTLGILTSAKSSAKCREARCRGGNMRVWIAVVISHTVADAEVS